MEAIVAERGQITLPKAVRDALGLVEPEGPIRGGAVHLGKAADDCPGKVVENTQSSEVSQHPVDSVQILAHVFQEEESSLEVGKVRGAGKTMEQSQVAANERTFGCSAGQGDNTVFLGDNSVLR